MTDPLAEAWEIIDAQDVLIEQQAEMIEVLEDVLSAMLDRPMEKRDDLW